MEILHCKNIPYLHVFSVEAEFKHLHTFVSLLQYGFSVILTAK